MKQSNLSCCGAVLGFLAVLAGAFGAHFLKARLGEGLLATFEVGVRYQMYHALVLLVLPLFKGRAEERGLLRSGWSFLLGVCLFSGSLYLLAFTGITAFGAVTPIGGVLLLIGWVLLTLSLVRGNSGDACC